MSFHFRRRRNEENQGVDDWLMTYADMITLLLCFFAVFLSVSVPRKDVFEKAREKVLEKFADPNMLKGMFPTPPGTGMTGGQYDKLPSIIDRYNSGEGQSAEMGLDGGKGDSIGVGSGPSDQNSGVPETDNGPDTEAGDRIITMEIPSAAFFDSGSATLNEEGETLLTELIDTQLSTEQFKDYMITVEGHTDDVPIKTLQFPSNWELSTSRAAAVVKFFIENGIPPQRLRAAGYADSFPKVANKDESGKAIPENQRQNRRVVIKLERIEKAERP